MTPQERRAALIVAGRATDVAGCRDLLEALGLLAPQPKRRGRRPIERDHGTVSRYEQGCRCDVCREAATIRSREWRARARKDPAAADRAGHGRASTYKNYSCRCDPCRAAHSAVLAARRERMAAQKAPAE
jgi:hypothetical protein